MDLIDPKGEHYNLRWNNYSNNLIQVFSEHQQREILVDTTLICEGEHVRAHKLILSACSGFFQEMFKNYGHVSNPFIVLNGIKLAHLRHIIEFIYHGEIKVLDTDLEGVLALGEHFQVKGLCSVKVKQSSHPKELNSVATSATVTVPTSDKLQTTTFDSINTQEKVSQPEMLSASCDSTPSRTLGKESRSVLKGQVSHISNYQNSFGKNLKARLAQLTNSEQPAKKKKTLILVKGETSHKINDSHLNKILDKENKEEQTIIGKPGNSSEDLQKSVPDREMLESQSPLPEGSIDQKTETIPRPVNAFMIFADEWRKKLSVEHPGDNSKSISVRLGNLWKSLSAETRESYYSAARQAQLEHQLKYPGYYVQVPTPTKVKVTARRKTVESRDYSIFNKDSDDELQIVEHHLDDSAIEENMPHSPTT